MNRTEAVLVIWSAVLTLYAFYAAVFLPRELMVSVTLSRLARRWPVIPFALGFLLAHWFWSQD